MCWLISYRTITSLCWGWGGSDTLEEEFPFSIRVSKVVLRDFLTFLLMLSDWGSLTTLSPLESLMTRVLSGKEISSSPPAEITLRVPSLNEMIWRPSGNFSCNKYKKYYTYFIETRKVLPQSGHYWRLWSPCRPCVWCARSEFCDTNIASLRYHQPPSGLRYSNTPGNTEQ